MPASTFSNGIPSVSLTCDSFIKSDHNETIDKSPITVEASGTNQANSAAKNTAAKMPYK